MSAMFPDSHSHAGRLRFHGFALPTGIFLMVILALLGAFIVRINVMQTGSQNLDVQGASAYQAARAGAEWAAYKILTPVAAPDCFTATNTPPGEPTYLTFAGTAMAPFTTSITCALSTADEVGVPQSIYQITATACNQPGAATPKCPNDNPTLSTYSERRITFVVAR